MLYGVRTYTCKLGKVKSHLALCAERGETAQTRCLDEPILFLVSAHADKRQRLMQNKDWLAIARQQAHISRGFFNHPPIEDKTHA